MGLKSVSEFGTDPHKLHRSGDPETSAIAANLVNTPRLEKLVYEAIASAGSRGLISDEVRDALTDKVKNRSSITPRYKALKDKGLICYSGEKRRGDSGRPQHVLIDIMWSMDMPKKPEEIIEDDTCEEAEKYGIGNRKLGYPNHRGAPDRLFVGYGKLLLAEFKRPGKNKKLDPLQVIEHEWFLDYGIEVAVFDNVNDALEFMADYFLGDGS
jgi:hypothetical protein